MTGLGVFVLATFGFLGAVTLAALVGLSVFFAAGGAVVVEGAFPVAGGSAAKAKPRLKNTALLRAHTPTKRRIPITSSCN